MHLIDAAGHANNQFVHEDPHTNRPPTEIDADWLNAVQNEIANVIRGGGVELDKGASDQLVKAVQKIAKDAMPGDASTEASGVVFLSSVEDAKAGERDDVVVTPEGLKAAIEGLNGLPIFFTGHHDGDRASLIRVFSGMATADDGNQLSALTHPDVVLGVLRGDVKTCTDAEWLADPYKRGMWSTGNASLDAQGKPQGWVRMSDRNGVQQGSLPAPFWRGGTDAMVGSIGKDTMRNLTGGIGGIGFNNREAVIDPSGVFGLGPVAAATASNNTGGPAGRTGFTFDASKGLPAGHTSTEFAPWNLRSVSYTITSNGVTNQAALDAAGIMAQVLALQGRVIALENAAPKGLGFNQNYATFTAAQRPLSTWFENLTPNPKFISAIKTPAGNISWLMDVRIAGVERVVSLANSAGETAVTPTLYGLVPVGGFYRIRMTVGTSDYTVQELTS